MQLSVRNVNERVFKKFKAKAAEKDISIGKALTMAMDMWLVGYEKKYNPTDLKPFRLGRSTRNLSEEIDKVLYGD